MARVYNMPRKIYAIIKGTVGLAVMAWALHEYPLRPEQWAYTILLAVLGIVLSAVGANVGRDTYLGLEATAYYAAMLSLGPAAAGFVALWPNIRWALTTHATTWALYRNTGMYALMGVAGGVVYQAVAGSGPLQ